MIIDFDFVVINIWHISRSRRVSRGKLSGNSLRFGRGGWGDFSPRSTSASQCDNPDGASEQCAFYIQKLPFLLAVHNSKIRSDAAWTLWGDTLPCQLVKYWLPVELENGCLLQMNFGCLRLVMISGSNETSWEKLITTSGFASNHNSQSGLCSANYEVVRPGNSGGPFA